MDLEEELSLTVLPSLRLLLHHCPTFQDDSDEQNGVTELDT